MKYRPASDPRAVHLVIHVPGPWGGTIKATACATPIAFSSTGAAPWTDQPRKVTCDACLMSDAFRAARAARRGPPPLPPVAEQVAAACRHLGITSEPDA